jgi:hypothetical protein
MSDHARPNCETVPRYKGEHVSRFEPGSIGQRKRCCACGVELDPKHPPTSIDRLVTDDAERMLASFPDYEAALLWLRKMDGIPT